MWWAHYVTWKISWNSYISSNHQECSVVRVVSVSAMQGCISVPMKNLLVWCLTAFIRYSKHVERKASLKKDSFGRNKTEKVFSPKATQ